MAQLTTQKNDALRDEHRASLDNPADRTLHRYGLYTLAFFGLGGFWQFAATCGDVNALKEAGLIERTQLGLLSAACVLLLVAAWRSRRNCKIVPALAAILVGIAIIRELDAVLDAWMPALGWQVPAFALIALAGMLSWRSRSDLTASLGASLRGRAAAILWAGFVVVLSGQAFGTGTVIEPLMQEHFINEHKRLIEEGIELTGYLLIVTGTFEANATARSQPDIAGETNADEFESPNSLHVDR